jgi:Cu-processing system ATP-binding protein
MIQVKNIDKRFRKLHALNSVNLEFTKGQVVSLIGPNGSGKTTLIKSIAALSCSTM